MWIESLRQLLNRSFQRIGEWARGLDLRPAWLVRHGPESPEQTRGESERGETQPVTNAIQVDWHADVSYRFRSLHCHARICILEPTAGMKFIYQALQEPCET